MTVDTEGLGELFLPKFLGRMERKWRRSAKEADNSEILDREFTPDQLYGNKATGRRITTP